MTLLELWSTWHTAIETIAGLTLGWYGKIAAARFQARQARLDAGQQALQLVQTMQDRERQLGATVASYSAELDRVRTSRWAVEDLLQQIHAAAISARMMVHGLEQRLGLQPTSFEPLPPFVVSSATSQPAAEPTTSSDQAPIRSAPAPP